MRRGVDQITDSWESALWIMDAGGSRHRFLIDGSNARWSPSGDRILFIAKGDDEKPQIFVLVLSKTVLRRPDGLASSLDA